MSNITYIVQMDGPDCLLKFGRTRSPKSRIAQLSTGVPWKLRVVALIGLDCERDIKRKFAASQVRGEWFRPTPDIQAFLDELADNGKLVKQVDVNQAYVNAVIKPRLREYLGTREASNTPSGDLVCRIFADMLPTLAGRETELVKATKGHVTDALCRGFGPTTDRATINLPCPNSHREGQAA
jgi:hypothetical protein